MDLDRSIFWDHASLADFLNSKFGEKLGINFWSEIPIYRYNIMADEFEQGVPIGVSTQFKISRWKFATVFPRIKGILTILC
jgi:hypothetical protein